MHTMVISSAYTQEVLRVAVSQLATNVGWHAIGDQSLELLVEVAERYMRSLARGAAQTANHSHRTQVALPDVLAAFRTCHVSVQELQDYINSCEPTPFPIRVKKFPANRRGASRLKCAPKPEEPEKVAVKQEEKEPAPQITAVDDLDHEGRVKQRLAELLSIQQDEEMEEVAPAAVKTEQQDQDGSDSDNFDPEDYYEPWLPPRVLDQKEPVSEVPREEAKVAEDKTRHLEVSELESVTLSSVAVSASGHVAFRIEGRAPDTFLPNDSEPEEELPPRPPERPQPAAPPLKLTLATKDVKGRKGKENEAKRGRKRKLGVLSIKVSGLKTGTPTASPTLGSSGNLDASIDAVIARAESPNKNEKGVKRRKKKDKEKARTSSSPSRDRSGSIVDDTINDVISTAMAGPSPTKTDSPAPLQTSPGKRSPNKQQKRFQDADRDAAAEILASMSTITDAHDSRSPVTGKMASPSNNFAPPFVTHRSPMPHFSPLLSPAPPHGSPLGASTPAPPKPFKTLAEKKAMPPLPDEIKLPAVTKEEKRDRKEKKKNKKDRKEKRDRKDKDRDDKKKRKEEKKERKEKEELGGGDIPRLSIKFSNDDDDHKKKERKEKKDKHGDIKKEKKDKEKCVVITETVKEVVERPKKDKDKKSKVKSEPAVVDVGEVPVVEDEDGKVWICPSCRKPDDGSPMIGCDECDDWYHWSCLGESACVQLCCWWQFCDGWLLVIAGIKSAPKEDCWFCKKCIDKQQAIASKFEKRKRPKDGIT